MTNTLYLPEIREMLAENKVDELREFCTALHPARTAEFMEGLTAEEAWAVLHHAEMPLRSEIFCFFEEEKQIAIVETIDREEIAPMIGEMPPDDRVDLLAEIKPEVVEQLMPLIPVAERRDIMRLSAYPEGTAGAEMTTEFARLSEGLNVGQAIEQIRRQADEKETIYYLYVVDREDHLRGLVSFRQLLVSKSSALVDELMERDIVSVNVSDDREDVAEKVERYDLLAIPVVDDEYRLVGIITHDDVIDVVREEAAEDAYRIAAVAPLDTGYLETGILSLTWKRGFWLAVVFAEGVLTALALEHYKHITEGIPWLIIFIPLLIATGGNTGNQSATLVITALSTGNVMLRDWWRVTRRELALGLLLGLWLGGMGYLCAILKAPNFVDALVVFLTLFLLVPCGTLCGSLLPLVFRRFGLDPALMSNPVVASMIDVLGILIYMNVAIVMLF